MVQYLVGPATLRFHGCIFLLHISHVVSDHYGQWSARVAVAGVVEAVADEFRLVPPGALEVFPRNLPEG